MEKELNIKTEHKLMNTIKLITYLCKENNYFKYVQFSAFLEVSL